MKYLSKPFMATLLTTFLLSTNINGRTPLALHDDPLGDEAFLSMKTFACPIQILTQDPESLVTPTQSSVTRAQSSIASDCTANNPEDIIQALLEETHLLKLDLIIAKNGLNVSQMRLAASQEKLSKSQDMLSVSRDKLAASAEKIEALEQEKEHLEKNLQILLSDADEKLKTHFTSEDAKHHTLWGKFKEWISKIDYTQLSIAILKGLLALLGTLILAL